MVTRVPKSEHQPLNEKQIDEHWLSEWVALGLKEIGILLAKHTAFAEYLKHKEHQG